MQRHLVAWFAFLLIGVGASSNVARANGITLTNAGDGPGFTGCGLRDAVTAAATNTATGGCPAGDADIPDVIFVGVGFQITLTSDLHVVDATIVGARSTSGLSEIDVPEGATLFLEGSSALKNITIRGGAIAARGTWELSDDFLGTETLSTAGTGTLARSTVAVATEIQSGSTVEIVDDVFASVGLAATASDVSVAGSLFFDGISPLLSASNSVFHIERSTFTGAHDGNNRVVSAVGSIFTIENCTLSNNAGDAVFSSDSDVSVSFCTIANNTGLGVNTEPLGTGSSLAVGQSIVVANDGGDCAAPVRSSGGNVFGSCASAQATDLTVADAKLGAVGLLELPPPTRALLVGSPAREAVDCHDIVGVVVTVDERGVVRPASACNPGAFQLGAELVSETAEPRGQNCPAGGVRITTGADLDQRGTLDQDEIEQTTFVCNGSNGSNGADGKSAASCSIEHDASGRAQLVCPDGHATPLGGCSCGNATAPDVGILSAAAVFLCCVSRRPRRSASRPTSAS